MEIPRRCGGGERAVQLAGRGYQPRGEAAARFAAATIGLSFASGRTNDGGAATISRASAAALARSSTSLRKASGAVPSRSALAASMVIPWRPACAAISVISAAASRNCAESSARLLVWAAVCVVMDLHRFCSGHVLMLGGPLFEGHW